MLLQVPDHRLLDLGGQTARLVDLRIGQQIHQDQLQVANLLQGCPVFAGNDLNRLVVLGKVKIVGFDAAGPAASVGVGVNRNKQVGADLVGNRRPLFQFEERITGPGHDDFAAELLFQLPGEDLGHGQYDFLLQYSARPDGAGVLAAMAGINDDTPQPLANPGFRNLHLEGALPGGGLEQSGDIIRPGIRSRRNTLFNG